MVDEIRDLTLEEVLNPDNSINFNAIFNLDDSIVINETELLFEYADLIEGSASINQEIVSMEAGFIKDLKQGIINILKKLVKFLKLFVKILITPFVFIFRLIEKLRKKNHSLINLHNKSIYGSYSIQGKAGGFTNDLKEYVDRSSEDTNIDGEILNKCKENYDFLKEEYEYLKTIDKSEISIDDQYNDYVERMKIKQKELEDFYNEHEFAYSTYKIETLRNKNKAIIDILDSIETSLNEYAKNEKNVQKNIQLSQKFISDLEKLQNEITNDKSLKPNFTKEINSVLNNIRFNIGNIAKRGIDISSWFFKADKIIDSINIFMDTAHLRYGKEDVVDTIGGIPIIIDDFLSLGYATYSSINNPLVELSAYKGRQEEIDQLSMLINGIINENTVSRIDLRDLRDIEDISYSPNDDFYLNNAIKTNTKNKAELSLIFISKELYKYKETDPKLYNFIIGHEYGHYLRESGYKKVEYGESKYVQDAIDEGDSDIIGFSIAGISSKEEIINTYNKILDSQLSSCIKEINSGILSNNDVYKATKFLKDLIFHNKQRFERSIREMKK